MASHFPASNADPVGDAIAIIRQQAGELLEARSKLIRARSLLRQSNVYVDFIIKRWEGVGMNGEPAASLKTDIDKFLEETGS